MGLTVLCLADRPDRALNIDIAPERRDHFARAFDRDLPTFRLDARTWQAILGIDLDTRVASYPVSFVALTGGRGCCDSKRP